jgi:hypothetical protein
MTSDQAVATHLFARACPCHWERLGGRHDGPWHNLHLHIAASSRHGCHRPSSLARRHSRNDLDLAFVLTALTRSRPAGTSPSRPHMMMCQGHVDAPSNRPDCSPSCTCLAPHAHTCMYDSMTVLKCQGILMLSQDACLEHRRHCHMTNKHNRVVNYNGTCTQSVLHPRLHVCK